MKKIIVVLFLLSYGLIISAQETPVDTLFKGDY